MNEIPITTIPRSRIRTALLTTLLAIAILGAYVGGYAVGRGEHITGQAGGAAGAGKVAHTEDTPAWLSRDVDFDVYWEAWKWVQDHYIDRPIAEPRLLYGSLAGMVAALDDPYSVFLEPRDAEEFSQTMQGSFEGIGTEIGIRENRLTVITPLAESPAERAGLKPLDWILKIDGRATDGIDIDDAVSRIRGPRGTSVVLTVMREGFDEARDYAITRDEIKIVSVTYEIKNNSIGYIKVTNFHADTTDRFRNAVSDLLARDIRALVVDVRNNPGGYLNSAIDMASYWVEEGKPIVLERSTDQQTKEYHALRNQVLSGMPTVVLVNRGSASASEILAGALQDYDYATIVGETTFGKGSIQELQEFSDRSAVKLTIARWLTPTERQIDGEGIAPDVEVIPKEEQDDGEGEEKQPVQEDPQMEKALEILTNHE